MKLQIIDGFNKLATLHDSTVGKAHAQPPMHKYVGP